LKTPKEIRELPWETGMTPNERSNNWYYYYLKISYYQQHDNPKYIKMYREGLSLKYCSECDMVWEFGNRVYDKLYNFRKRLTYHYDRDSMPFYGLIDNKDKHSICVKCKKGDRDE